MNWICRFISHKFKDKTCVRCGLHPTCPVCGHQV